MTFWVVRAGRRGEIEHEALEKNRVAIGWGSIPDMSHIQNKEQLRDLYIQHYPDDTKARLWNRVGQIWNFIHSIKEGDLVALPLKSRSFVAIGKVTGAYRYDAASQGAQHQRAVSWKKEIPRSDFPPDIRFSLGMLQTVGRVRASDAERRVNNMLVGRPSSPPSPEADPEADLETLANDSIIRFIEQRFRGHDLARLIDGILKSKGYVTRMSPPGPDGGVDILAASGSLGFDDPRICVQVKSSRDPVGIDILNQLNGVVQKFGASHGILVAWGGLTRPADKDMANAFFRTRLWDQTKIVDELVSNYDQLDDELKSEIPLRRMWAVIESEQEPYQT